MKEDFVTYEQALALNKLGFREECLYYYNRGGMLVSNYYDSSDGIYVENLYISYNSRHKITNKYDAPTLAQAQKWLRKEKKLSVEPVSGDTDEHGWEYGLVNRNYEHPQFSFNNVTYSSYEEALSIGITECLKLLDEIKND